MGLSLLLRGTLLEKLEWTFNLYDINQDGIITADELYMIVSSVYDIIGNFTEPRVDESSIRDHVDTVFKVRQRLVPTLYTATYREIPTRSGLQFKVTYLQAMTLGGAAQVGAAHCLNEQTLDPPVCS